MTIRPFRRVGNRLLVIAAGKYASLRCLEFFAAKICTRSYSQAIRAGANIYAAGGDRRRTAPSLRRDDTSEATPASDPSDPILPKPTAEAWRHPHVRAA